MKRYYFPHTSLKTRTFSLIKFFLFLLFIIDYHVLKLTNIFYDESGIEYVTVYESNMGYGDPEGGLNTMTVDEFKTRLGGKYQGCIDLMGNN